MNLHLNAHVDITRDKLRGDILADFARIRVGDELRPGAVTLILREDDPVALAAWLRDAAEQLSDLAVRVERRAAVRAVSA